MAIFTGQLMIQGNMRSLYARDEISIVLRRDPSLNRHTALRSIAITEFFRGDVSQ